MTEIFYIDSNIFIFPAIYENEKAIISGKILTFLSRKSSSETADQKSLFLRKEAYDFSHRRNCDNFIY